MVIVSPFVASSMSDPKRNAAARRLGLADMPREAAFDRLTRLATRLLGTEAALVNVIADGRQLCKSSVGLPEPWATDGLPLDFGLCPYVVASEVPLLVGDARTDSRFRDNRGVHTLGIAGYAGAPLRCSDGQVVGALCAFDHRPRAWTDNDLQVIGDLAAAAMTEIELRASERQLREERGTLETINRVGHLLTAELDLARLVQAVTDAATELTRAQFGAFFYNVADAQGERYTLYALAGVPREAFATFPMPRNTDVFGPTFRGEAVIRIADVRLDQRYGKNAPYYGLPSGHLPVASYLAVPVIGRAGEVLGGLFFGHSEPGVFDERAEQIAIGLAAHAAVAVDNARLFQQVQEELAKRRQAEADKQAFLDAVAHDLRNPLGAAKAQAQLLRRRVKRGQIDLDGVENGLTGIDGAINRASRLISELQDLAHLEAGQPLELQSRPIDLVALVRSAVEEQQATFLNHSIQFEAVHAPLIGAWDSDRLRRVVSNVLENAVKFSPGGGPISVSVQREDVGAGERAVLEVSDSGVGIPSEDIPRIFERYHRGGNVAGRIAGSGLGLWGAKHIIEQHGGAISIESAESEGTTVTIRLTLGSAGPVHRR
jgi:signal transduction histidine kinase